MGPLFCQTGVRFWSVLGVDDPSTVECTCFILVDSIRKVNVSVTVYTSRSMKSAFLEIYIHSNF